MNSNFFKFKLNAFVAYCLALACLMNNAHADIPEDYQPMVIYPPTAFTERVFDLTSVFARANKENKPIFFYIGAKDCAPCKLYEQYLSKNQDELLPIYSQFIVADLRTWLRGPAIKFKVGNAVMTYAEFMIKIENYPAKQLVYPSIWILSPSGSIYQSYTGTTLMDNTQGHLANLQESIRRIKLANPSASRF
jgi:thiol-disulfide isomerase/thioredoxin